MGAADRAIAKEAATLATDCTDAFFGLALQGPSRRWPEGPTRIGRLRVTLEFRKLSPYLEGPLTLMRARDVPATVFGGQRFVSRGFGVPLAVIRRAATTVRCASCCRAKACFARLSPGSSPLPVATHRCHGW